MAEKRGLSIPQMLLQDIFKYVSLDVDRFPEDEIRQKKEKFFALKRIYKACQKLGLSDGLDLTKARELKQYTKVPKLQINLLPSIEENPSQKQLQTNTEPDEDVFQSEDSDDEGQLRIGTSNLRLSKTS